MADYTIIVTQRAFVDVTECVSFVRNVSVEAAKQLYDEIICSINSLMTLPNKYPEIDGLTIGGSKVRKMPIHQGRYVALYKAESHTITIYDILDVRKDSFLNKI